MNHITYLLDRQALRAALGRWRTFAFLSILASFLLFAAFIGKGKHLFESRHVALLSISGPIMTVDSTLELLKDVEDNPHAMGALVKINSPGGTASGAEQLYHGLRSLGGKKPVVAVIENLAASGGYIAAIGADYIVAQETSLLGSIGVLFQTPNFHEALKKLGIEMDVVKSTALKATPDMFSPALPETKHMLEGLVADIYGWFKRLVVERRNLSSSQLAIASNGAIFTGSQALDLRLIDVLGDQRQARDWLKNVHHIPETIPLRKYHGQGSHSLKMLSSIFSWGQKFLGLSKDGDLYPLLAHNGLKDGGILALWPGYIMQTQP
jgi:protease-4